MPTWKDNKGHEWTIRLDGPTVKMVRAQTCETERCHHRPLIDKGCTAVDLAEFSGATYQRFDVDWVLWIDVMYLVCRDQAKDAGITDEEFGARLGGVETEAWQALQQACFEFLPPQKRQFLQKVIEKTERARELAQRATMARLEKRLDPAMVDRAVGLVEAQLDAAVGLTPPTGATSSPASSESGPTD